MMTNCCPSSFTRQCLGLGLGFEVARFELRLLVSKALRLASLARRAFFCGRRKLRA
jgi:hypothetical protein